MVKHTLDSQTLSVSFSRMSVLLAPRSSSQSSSEFKLKNFSVWIILKADLQFWEILKKQYHKNFVLKKWESS